MSERFLDIKSTAKFLSVSESRVYRLIRERDLVTSPMSLSGSVRVSERSLRAYKKRRDAWLKIHGRRLASPKLSKLL